MTLKTMSILSLALLLGVAPGLQAQVYSWTDAQGRKHYGDAASAPPARAQAIDVRVSQPASLRVADADPDAIKDPSVPAPKPTADQKACQEATRNRDLLADQNKKVMKAGDAGAVEMTLDDRAAALDRAQKQMQMYCKSA